MKTQYRNLERAGKKKPRDRVPVDGVPVDVPGDGVPVWVFDGHMFPSGADIVTINESGPVARFFFISPTHRAGDRRGVELCASR